MIGFFEKGIIPGTSGEFAVSYREEEKIVFVVNNKNRVSPNEAVASGRELFFFSTKTLCEVGGVSYQLVYVFWTRESAMKGWEKREEILAKRTEEKGREMALKNRLEREKITIEEFIPIKARIAISNKKTIFANPTERNQDFSLTVIVRDLGGIRGIRFPKNPALLKEVRHHSNLMVNEYVWIIPITIFKKESGEVIGWNAVAVSFNLGEEGAKEVAAEIKKSLRHQKNGYDETEYFEKGGLQISTSKAMRVAETKKKKTRIAA